MMFIMLYAPEHDNCHDLVSRSMPVCYLGSGPKTVIRHELIINIRKSNKKLKNTNCYIFNRAYVV